MGAEERAAGPGVVATGAAKHTLQENGGINDLSTMTAPTTMTSK